MYEEGNRRSSLNWGSLAIKIAILVVIVFLACWIFVRVSNNKTNAKNVASSSNTEYITNIAAMKTAAFEYFTAAKLPAKVGGTEKLTLNQMLNQKLLIDFTDDGKTCDVNDSYVQTTKTADGNYALKVSLTCGDKSDFIVTTIEDNASGDKPATNTDVIVVDDNTKTNNNSSKSNSSSSSNSSTKSNSSTTKNNTASSNTAKNNTTTTTRTVTTTTTIKTTVYFNFSCTTNCNTVNKYTVTFDTQGGSYVAPVKVDAGKSVTRPTNPTKDGYVFAGWTLNGKDYNFNNAVTSDITLVAKWTAVATRKVVVTFDTQGGTYIESVKIDVGKTVTRPVNPTKNGYTFVEWQLNGKTYDFSNAVTNNIKLVAVWRKNNTTTRYYEYVKWSDWTDGYSYNSLAENRLTNVAYNTYCKYETRNYYSVSYVSDSTPYNSNYSYEFQMLSLDPTKVYTNSVSILQSSVSYFSNDGYTDYNSYMTEKNIKEVYMTDNNTKYDSLVPNVFVLKPSSMTSNNYSFSVSNAYLSNNTFRTKITVHYKNNYNVPAYYASNLGYNVYFAPVKFTVRYANKSNCIEDLAANASRYSNNYYNAGSANTRTVWQYRIPTYTWSTSTSLNGWSRTGAWEDR